MFEFVSDDGDYYVVEIDGEEIYLQVGTFKRLVYFDDLDLDAEWHSFYGSDLEKFRDTLASKVIDPDRTFDVTLCEDCVTVAPDANEMVAMQHGYVCEDCSMGYTFCEYCDTYVHNDDSAYIDGSDERVCESCCDRYFTYCDSCEGYQPNDYPCDCGDGCDCEAPVQSFTIRNDGQAPLANDVPLAVTLPAGVVSEQGIAAMQSLIHEHARVERDKAFGVESGGWYQRDNAAHQTAQEDYRKWWDFAHAVATLDAKWQTKDGNFTKRLSRMAYKTYGLKVPPAMLSEIGNIGNQHSQGVDFEVETTRDLNQSAEAFGHGDSCYWQSYYSSRCTLKNNGAFGLRSFSGDRGSWNGGVSGRAWVLPLKSEDGDLTPTFDAQGADAFVVFNGYGDLGGYAPARIMAHLAGMTYRKIGFTFGEAYINAGGYLIAPEEIATDYTDGALNLHVDPHSALYSQEKRAAEVVAVA